MPRSDLFESDLFLQQLAEVGHFDDLWVSRQDRIFEIPSTISFLKAVVYLLFTPLEDGVKRQSEAKLIFTIIAFALWDLTRLNSRKRRHEFESAVEFIFLNDEPLKTYCNCLGIDMEIVRNIARQILRGSLRFKHRTRTKSDA